MGGSALVVLVGLLAQATGKLQDVPALEAAGRDEEALALADRLVRGSPAWELPRLEAARLRLKQGVEPGLAELDLEVARTLAPENPRAHFLHGQLMEEQRQDADAARSYRLALVYRADYDQARQRLAGLLHAAGKWEEAEEHYRELSRRMPRDVQARLQLASALERQGRVGEAERELSAVWEAEPRSPLAGRRLAELYERTGEPQKAAQVRRALEGPPKTSKPRRPLQPSRR